MKKQNATGLILLIMCVFVLFIASCAKSTADNKTSEETGKQAGMGFMLKDLNGSDIDLHKVLNNKAGLLEFTTTWCPHCVTAIPGMKRAHEKSIGRNFEVAAIYIKEPSSKIRDFVKKHGIPYKVFIDTDGQAASLFEVRGVPTFILIDSKGNIVYKGYSVPEEAIGGLLGKQK
jgi:cytochrome c biogenesis protein CcmG, thiol:disulfide interchange protein DsbE